MAELRPTILLVEDEPEIRRFLRTSLGSEGFRVVESATGRRGSIDAATHKPDVAIVDLGLPDMDGIAVISNIRSWSPMPIIVLSARVLERGKIEAFEAGADDYVTKPFGIGELVARIRVALRRAVRLRNGERVLLLDDASIDLEKRRVLRGGAEIRLTPIEFRLVAVLARHAGRVVTHRQLLREVWGPTHENDTHYLRIYVKQLRDKLESDPANPRHFVTELGVGYRLELDGVEGAVPRGSAGCRPPPDPPQRGVVAFAGEVLVEQPLEHGPRRRNRREQRRAGPELQIVGRAEDLVRGASCDREHGVGALDEPRTEDGVGEVGLGLRGAPDREAPGGRADPQSRDTAETRTTSSATACSRPASSARAIG